MSRSELKFIIIPRLVKWLIDLITLTCRVRWHNRETLENLIANDQPFLISMWHNCSTIAPWAMRNRQIACIVSDSRDGEYVARLGALFGNKTVRGSSSKGSSRVTRSLLKLLRNGEPIAMTPDGPRGPVYRVQNGVVWLAAAGRAPVLPLHIEATQQWVLKSWDKHRFPKPFSTIHIGIGDPTQITSQMLSDNPQHCADLVQHAMMENVRKLQTAAGHQLEYATGEREQPALNLNA
jgi:hypothetical protein